MQKSILYRNCFGDGKIATFDTDNQNIKYQNIKHQNIKHQNIKHQNTTKKQRRNRKKMTKTKDVDFYVVRVDCHGKLSDSKPCNQCLDALKRVGIRKVFYSTSNGTIMEEKVANMFSTHISHGQKVLKINKPIKIF